MSNKHNQNGNNGNNNQQQPSTQQQALPTPEQEAAARLAAIPAHPGTVAANAEQAGIMARMKANAGIALKETGSAAGFALKTAATVATVYAALRGASHLCRKYGIDQDGKVLDGETS